jgi:hypothetical protein
LGGIYEVLPIFLFASLRLFSSPALMASVDEEYRLTGYRSMDRLLFWLGIGAAQKGAGSKPTKRGNWVVSLVLGTLTAVLIAVGMFLLLVSQQ